MPAQTEQDIEQEHDDDQHDYRRGDLCEWLRQADLADGPKEQIADKASDDELNQKAFRLRSWHSFQGFPSQKLSKLHHAH